MWWGFFPTQQACDGCILPILGTYKTRVGRHKDFNEGLFEARPDP